MATQIAVVTPVNGAPRAPYALDPTPFPFPGLAAMAGRAGMGGPREVALACLVVARLAREACAGCGLTAEQRRARATAARQWLGSTSVPAPVRAALVKLADATGGDDPKTVGTTLDSVIAVTANQLDQAARLELTRLAQAIASQHPSGLL
jgi:hypothetical protein